jgi:hypothetical protein
MKKMTKKEKVLTIIVCALAAYAFMETVMFAFAYFWLLLRVA